MEEYMTFHANQHIVSVSLDVASPPAPAEGLARLEGLRDLQTGTEKALETAIENAVREAMAAAAAARAAGTEAAADAARERVQAAMEDVRAQLEASRAAAQPAVQVPPFPPDAIPPQAVDIAVAFFAMIAFIAVGIPLARALGKRWERRGTPTPADLGPRLDRLEQAVEAVAIEVERISEGQRYATKVMTELRGLPASQPDAWPGKVAREAEPAPRPGESR
jgi:hypothetical protein